MGTLRKQKGFLNAEKKALSDDVNLMYTKELKLGDEYLQTPFYETSSYTRRDQSRTLGRGIDGS